MTVIKTADLIGPALDWAVATALGWHRATISGIDWGKRWTRPAPYGFWKEDECEFFAPSNDPAQGYPILQRERVSWDGTSYAVHPNFKPSPTGGDFHPIGMRGTNFLIAGLRCFVAQRLGDEIDIPMELLA